MDREKLKERQEGIGGSDVAAIVGANPYKGPVEVWHSKVFPLPEENEREWSDSREYGVVAEDAVMQVWQKRRAHEGKPVTIEQGTTFIDESFPCLRANPDFYVTETATGVRKILEIKTARIFLKHKWGKPGTQEIPLEYKYQVAWYCELTGIHEAIIVVEIDHQIYEYKYIHDTFDPFFGRQLRNRMLKWWDTHVVPNRKPEVDGSNFSMESLLTEYPKDLGDPVEVPTDDGIVDTVLKYKDTKEQIAKSEAECERYKQLICERIGSTPGIFGEFGKITWKKNKAGSRVFRATLNKHFSRSATSGVIPT